MKKAKKPFLNSEVILKTLIQKLLGADPLASQLQQLLTAYQLALDQAPIQLPVLYQIEVQEQQVLKTPTGDPVREALSLSLDFLRSGIDYAKKGMALHARFFISEAKEWLRRARDLLSSQTPTPTTILEEAIQDQSHALILNRLNYALSSANDKIKNILDKSQRITLETAQPFLASVRESQAEDFALFCRCSPWDIVVPLFEKGKDAARKALELLNKDPLMAMHFQEQAEKYWKQAESALKHPEEPQKKEQKKEEPEKEKLGEKKPEPQEKAPQEMQEILRLLQQMEGDDRRPEPKQPPPQSGERPW